MLQPTTICKNQSYNPLNWLTYHSINGSLEKETVSQQNNQQQTKHSSTTVRFEMILDPFFVTLGNSGNSS